MKLFYLIIVEFLVTMTSQMENWHEIKKLPYHLKAYWILFQKSYYEKITKSLFARGTLKKWRNIDKIKYTEPFGTRFVIFITVKALFTFEPVPVMFLVIEKFFIIFTLFKFIVSSAYFSEEKWWFTPYWLKFTRKMAFLDNYDFFQVVEGRFILLIEYELLN